MFRRMLLTVAMFFTVVAPSAFAQTSEVSLMNDTGAVSVGGATLHYEVHGDGPPPVLLHGGVSPAAMFGAPLAAIAKTHRVVDIHMRGHGLSTDTDAPWSTQAMADDVAAVLEQLGISRASVMGYSMGAGVALQVAIRHTELVDRLVAVSFGYRNDG